MSAPDPKAGPGEESCCKYHAHKAEVFALKAQLAVEAKRFVDMKSYADATEIKLAEAREALRDVDAAFSEQPSKPNVIRDAALAKARAVLAKMEGR